MHFNSYKVSNTIALIKSGVVFVKKMHTGYK